MSGHAPYNSVVSPKAADATFSIPTTVRTVRQVPYKRNASVVKYGALPKYHCQLSCRFCSDFLRDMFRGKAKSRLAEYCRHPSAKGPAGELEDYDFPQSGLSALCCVLTIGSVWSFWHFLCGWHRLVAHHRRTSRGLLMVAKISSVSSFVAKAVTVPAMIEWMKDDEDWRAIAISCIWELRQQVLSSTRVCFEDGL